jgi:hypothetical protein
MTANKPIDSYDEIKGMLTKVRNIQALSKANTSGLIKEQTYQGEVDDNPQKFQSGDPNTQIGQQSTEKYFSDEDKDTSSTNEGEDLMVINNVEVEIHSEDPEDLQLSDEEKGKISQLIDDFRAEVSEIAEFDKLHIYSDSAKLDGKIGDIGLNFTLSTGDDTGLYLSNPSMLKIDDNSLAIINKLRVFESKYSNIINDLLVTRSTT